MQKMTKLLLITMLLLTVLGFYVPTSGYAMDKSNVFIATADSAKYYDHILVKCVSLGRTNREKVLTVGSLNSSLYSQFTLMNFVYTDKVLINAQWYEDGPSSPVQNISLTISEDTLRDKARGGSIYLLLYPDRIEIQ